MINNQFEINLEKYSFSEQKNILQLLSSFDNQSLLHFDNSIKELVEKRSRGWANFFRKGISKIHRYCAPKIITYHNLYGSGKQPLLQMYHRFKKHDHQRNNLLISLREREKKRLNIRSERQEMYSAIDLAILKYLDIDKFGIGLFEVTCSVEMLAKTINIYRIDKSGHARYDTLLNAINDYEKSKQIIVYREFDNEKKVYKPCRLWLTIEFFKERGYTEEELRNLLKSREQYLYKKNLFSKSREYYQTQYLQRLDKAGILNPPAPLVKKLIRIKNKLLDMHYEKESIKRAKKQKKQAEQEINNSQKRELTYHEIFEQYLINNNIATAQKFIVMNKVASKYSDKTDPKYWLECLIEVGWSPPN